MIDIPHTDDLAVQHCTAPARDTLNIYKIPKITNCKRPFSDWWERLRGRDPDQWMIDASEYL